MSTWDPEEKGTSMQEEPRDRASERGMRRPPILVSGEGRGTSNCMQQLSVEEKLRPLQRLGIGSCLRHCLMGTPKAQCLVSLAVCW